jgi:hypothetical protein
VPSKHKALTYNPEPPFKKKKLLRVGVWLSGSALAQYCPRFNQQPPLKREKRKMTL